jgi:pimeloyl-ACP methyl ester carboxylesterase
MLNGTFGSFCTTHWSTPASDSFAWPLSTIRSIKVSGSDHSRSESNSSLFEGAPLADYLEVYTVPNTGHSIQREDPDAIVQAALRDEMPGYFQQHN